MCQQQTPKTVKNDTNLQKREAMTNSFENFRKNVEQGTNILIFDV